MPKKFQTKPETEPVYEAEYPVEYEPDDAAVSERLGTHAQLGYPPSPEGLICEEGHTTVGMPARKDAAVLPAPPW